MINFVSKDEKTQQKVSLIRRMVVTICSTILVVYLVVVAGVLGWALLWRSKENRATSEIEEYTQKVLSLKEAEAIVRKLESRAMMVDNFLSSRGNASGAAYGIENELFKIVQWDYALGSNHTVKVEATTAAALNDYEKYLAKNFLVVQTSKIEFLKGQRWVGTFVLSPAKRGS